MDRYCIVVADAAKARIFSLAATTDRAEPLEETHALVNPEHRMADHALFSEPRPGRMDPRGHAQQSTDDHRSANDEAATGRFADLITKTAVETTQGSGADQLILVAGPQMLGQLRRTVNDVAKSWARSVEHPKDLSGLSPTEIHVHLSNAGLVPPTHRKTRDEP